MRTVDHKLLALLIEERYMKNIPAKYKRIFYFGCVEPDYNPLSYLHGFSKFFNLYGHNFSNVKFFIGRLFERLNKADKPGVMFFYRLGLLVHYITDAFTYAHTSEFAGSLNEHQRYEQRLHLAFKRLAENNMVRFSDNLLTCKDIDSLSQFHKIYLKSEISVFNDMTFIFSLIGSIMTNFEPVLAKADNHVYSTAGIRTH